MYKNVSIHRKKSSTVLVSFEFWVSRRKNWKRTNKIVFNSWRFRCFLCKKNTTQIHKRNFIFVHICLDQPIRTKNLALYREILFQIFFTFFPTIFPPRNPSPNHTQHFPVLSALYFNTPSSSPPLLKNSTNVPTQTSSCRLLINRMFRYRVTAINRIDFNTDTWTLPLETRYKLEFTHRVVKSSSNNGYNTTTGADIDLRRPAIQNVSRSRLRVTSRFQTTCGSVSVLRFSFIGIIRRTKTLTIVLPPVGRKGKFYTVIRRNSRMTRIAPTIQARKGEERGGGGGLRLSSR